MKLLALSLFAAAALAQPSLTPEIRKSVIDGAIGALNKNYVFPDVAKKMETAIRERAAKGEYDSITTPTAFAERLTADLQAVSRDKHLRVRAAAPGGGGGPAGPPPTASNEGFVKAEILEGNIGYIDLRGFAPVERAADAAAAAMSFVAKTDGLIIDLRSNGGGSPDMVAHLCSYFFDKAMHINSVYWRPNDTTRDLWSKAEVAGKKYLDKPVWLLTSTKTFSGGEEFAYDLKVMKRATLVGETTGGGAHPVMGVPLTNGFSIGVPAGRAINPVTKSNWEGTGVEPDVKIAAADALAAAHMAAKKATRPSADAPAITELPKTPAGTALAAFVAALNSGDIEKMKAFHRDRGGNAENGERDLGFYQDSGGVEIVKISGSKETEIETVVRFKKGGGHAAFSMSVKADPPHAVAGISVRPI